MTLPSAERTWERSGWTSGNEFAMTEEKNPLASDHPQQRSETAPTQSPVSSPVPGEAEWELDVHEPLPWAVEEEAPEGEGVPGVSADLSTEGTAAALPAPRVSPAPSLSSPHAPADHPSPSCLSKSVCPSGRSPSRYHPDKPVDPPALEQILEAMLFVGGPPLTAETAAMAIRGLTEEAFHQSLHELNRRYRRQKRPYAIVSREKGYVLELLPAYRHLRERIYGGPRTVRLSQAALDVLAIVAYRQPLTKAEVDALRGQESGPQLRQLLRLGLITMLHRGERLPISDTLSPAAIPNPTEQAPSTPRDLASSPDLLTVTSSSPDLPPVTSSDTSTQAVRYGTTPRFLRFFGLTSLDDLPRLTPSDA